MRLSQASTLKIAFISIGLRVKVNSRKVPWSKRCFHYVQSQCFAKPKVSIGSMTDEFMLLLVLFTVLYAVQIVESTSTTWSISVIRCTQSSSSNICWIKIASFRAWDVCKAMKRYQNAKLGSTLLSLAVINEFKFLVLYVLRGHFYVR